MSAYPIPPPTYGSAEGSHHAKYTDDPASRDLMSDFAGVGAGSSAAGRAAYFDQPSHGDLPDDFKVRCWLFLVACISVVLIESRMGLVVWCHCFGEFGRDQECVHQEGVFDSL